MATIVHYMIASRLWNLLEDKTILGVPGQTWLTNKATNEGWSFEVSDVADGQQNIGQSGDRIQFTQAEIDDLRAATEGGFFPRIDLANEFLQTTGGGISEAEPEPGGFVTIFSDDFNDSAINPFWSLAIPDILPGQDPGFTVAETDGQLKISGTALNTNFNGLAALADGTKDTILRTFVDVTNEISQNAQFTFLALDGNSNPFSGIAMLISQGALNIAVLKSGVTVAFDNLGVPSSGAGQAEILWNATTKVFNVSFGGLLYESPALDTLVNPYIFLAGAHQGGLNIDVRFDNFSYERKP